MANRGQTTSPSTRQAGCPYILFSDEEGILWMRGNNLAKAKKLLALSSDQKALPFDPETAKLYVDELTEQGVTVGIVQRNTMRTLLPVPRCPVG